MRIHVHTLPDFADAARYVRERTGAPVYFEARTEHRSRTHPRAYEIKLSSDGSLSRRRRNPGASRDRSALDTYAATWDQWGWFLARMFATDPGARVANVYADAADFHKRTRGAYVN